MHYQKKIWIASPFVLFNFNLTFRQTLSIIFKNLVTYQILFVEFPVFAILCYLFTKLNDVAYRWASFKIGIRIDGCQHLVWVTVSNFIQNKILSVKSFLLLNYFGFCRSTYFGFFKKTSIKTASAAKNVFYSKLYHVQSEL